MCRDSMPAYPYSPVVRIWNAMGKAIWKNWKATSIKHGNCSLTRMIAPYLQLQKAMPTFTYKATNSTNWSCT